MSPRFRHEDIQKRIDYADDPLEAEFYGNMLPDVAQDRHRNDTRVGEDTTYDDIEDFIV